MKVMKKIRNGLIYATAIFRHKKLNNDNFTIISNNCWGGMVYKSWNMAYLSPTVGLFFMPDDYIKFLKNLKYYLSIDLDFIDKKESKWRGKIEEEIDYPIGKLEDIEIFFVHYNSEEEALEKWNRRKKRVDFTNLLIKISDQNFLTQSNLDDFDKLNFKNKIAFIGPDFNSKNKYQIAYRKNKKYIDINDEPKIKIIKKIYC